MRVSSRSVTGPRARRHPWTAVLVASALLTTACGSRLTDEQRAAMAAGAGAEAAGTDGAAAPLDSDGGLVVPAPGADTPATAAPDTGTDPGVASPEVGAPGGDPGTSAPADDPAGDPGSTAAPGDTAPADDATAPATQDTRSAPPGGNGGATDVGVTEDEVILFNVADVSGAVPGIFHDAQLAAQAYVAYFTATEGTIYGRRIRLVTRDSQLDSSQNRAHYQDACREAFGAIGSMSAFDEGAVGPIEECKLPDLRAAAVNPAMNVSPTVFAADATSSTLYPTNDYLYWMETHPGIEKKAGILYIENDTTRSQTRQIIGATQRIGYEWLVDEAIGLTETNYSSYVIRLKNEGVEFVNFQGDVPQVVRLAQAMRQQDYWPTVFGLQQNIYSPKLITQGGSDVEGVEVAVGSVLLENIEHHPELQLYREWLKRVSPQAEPTGMGMYSWAASALFIDLMKDIGPNLTRAAMVDAISQVNDYTGNGLFPPQEVGDRIPSSCHIIVRVQDAAFVPIDPPGGLTFGCRGRAEPST